MTRILRPASSMRLDRGAGWVRALSCLVVLLVSLLSGCGSARRLSPDPAEKTVAVASCAAEPLSPVPLPRESGVYREGPLTLVTGEDLAELPPRQVAHPQGVETIAVLAGHRTVTLSVDPRSRARFSLQFTPLFRGHPDALISDGRPIVRFPACGQGVHRFGGGILFKGRGCIRLYVRVEAAKPIPMLIPIGSTCSTHARATAMTGMRPGQPVTGPLHALVTAQTENRLLLVGLPGGHVIRAVSVPGDPTYVAAAGKVVVVVSSGSGTVTLLDRRSLHLVRVFHGFSSPHIPAISPDARYAYVTDDASGKVAVIGLYDHKLIARAFIGPGAHHLAFSPDERRVWIALGQSAQTLTILRTVTASGKADPGQPRVAGYLHPEILAHDLLFTPGGKQVWITSSDTSYVGVFSSRTSRLLFRVPAGPPPQHLVFANGYAYITSGYGSSIEQVNLYTHRVLRRTSAPYGSFDLDAGGGYVVTASLFRGTLAIYSRQLRLLRVRQLAPSTEDVALSAS